MEGEAKATPASWTICTPSQENWSWRSKLRSHTVKIFLTHMYKSAMLVVTREKLRYHTDDEYRQRRQLACRKSYLIHAEKKRASVYGRLVRLGLIKKPKLLERYGLEPEPREHGYETMERHQDAESERFEQSADDCSCGSSAAEGYARDALGDCTSSQPL